MSSSVATTQPQTPIASDQLVSAVVEEHIASSEPETNSSKSKSVQEYLDIMFGDTPILKEVAWCESRNRQFDETGTVIRGKVNSLDVGVMQINEKYHAEDAKKLGLNIYTVEGNLAYAKHIYEKQGTRPWKASRPCWGDK